MANILIVEDDNMMAKVYEKAFRFGGHEVDIATNGLDGLEKLKAKIPDLIVLDLMMPKMNGLQFLENVKSEPKTKDIPVVVLTNLASESDALLALSKGAVKYIVKSKHDPTDAVKMIDEVLAGRTTDETPETPKSD